MRTFIVLTVGALAITAMSVGVAWYVTRGRNIIDHERDYNDDDDHDGTTTRTDEGKNGDTRDGVDDEAESNEDDDEGEEGSGAPSSDLRVRLNGGYSRSLLRTDAITASATNVNPLEIYVATFNFSDVTQVYLEQVWDSNDVAWRIQSRDTMNNQMEINKRNMIENIKNHYKAQRGDAKVLERNAVLFFDDSVDNVAQANAVCIAHHVNGDHGRKGITRQWLAQWLVEQGEPVGRPTQSTSVSDVAKRFVAWCVQNKVRVVVFDLDQTLLAIHSFYQGVTAEAMRRGERNAVNDFADLELLQCIAQHAEKAIL